MFEISCIRAMPPGTKCDNAKSSVWKEESVYLQHSCNVCNEESVL